MASIPLLYQERESWRGSLLIAAMIGCVLALLIYALAFGTMMESALEAARMHPLRFWAMTLFILSFPVYGLQKAFRTYTANFAATPPER